MLNIKKSKALILGNIGIFLMVVAGMCLIYEIAYLYSFNKKDKGVMAISIASSIGGVMLAPLRPKTSARQITSQKYKGSCNEYDISIWYQKNSKVIKTINLNDITEVQSTNDFTFDINASIVNDNLCLSVEVNSQNFNDLATLCQIDIKDGKELILQKESELCGIIWRIGINSQELRKNNIKNFNFRFLVLAEDEEKRIIEKFSKWYGYDIDSKTVLL